VRVRRAAVCGTDLHVLAHPLGLPESFVLGHEFAGDVVAVGSLVRTLSVGDRVAGADYTACGHCWWCRRGDHWECPHRQFFGTGAAFGPPLPGCQAELVRVPFADTVLRTLPPDLPLDAAVLVGDTLATGFAAVQRADLRPGDTVVVVGGGPVGQLTSLVAQACAAGSVVLVEPVASRREVAVAEGALVAPPEEARALVDRLTDGRGADAVVDAVGGTTGLDTALDLVRRRGVVVSVGVHPPGGWRMPTDRAFAGELTLRFAIGDAMRDGDSLLAFLRSGAIDPTSVVSEVFPLAEAGKAYERMAGRHTLKALIAV
jgi:alcohol dehydrogenase